MSTCTEPELLDRPEAHEKGKTDKAWNVVVWNDPVNTMDFVVFVFMKVLGMDNQVAHKHMMEVHNKGKSLVYSGEKEKAEHFMYQILTYHLKATLEQIE